MKPKAIAHTGYGIIIALAFGTVFCGVLTAQDQSAESPASVEVPAPAPTEAPKKPLDPDKSFARLAHPSVAARLGLSDEQRAEIQRLLAVRAQELAKAPEEQWATVIERNEQKLADVLTSAQKTLWPQVFDEKRIRIMFKLQRWSDVLQWFAEQAGLQLVMDAPPPGTFNYADQREYTPAEAIDLLNSVLQTKGYTLIRNDKMLMLFDLKRGRIPVQFLPKLKPEQLSQRGRFEYTTVIFPLERRNRSDVIRTLNPFKGPYCQIVPMPGNSLMITDTASTLLVLQKVIESVENPASPSPPAASAEQPSTPSVWKTYRVEKNDPGRIEEIFKEFAPTGKSLRIGNSREIHYFLPEAQQQQLADILKMLEDDSGVAKDAPVLASYSIAPYLNPTLQQLWRLGRQGRRFSPAATAPGQPYTPLNSYEASMIVGKEIIEILKKTFPAAVVSDTPVANNVVVLASAADQEKIKDFFDSLKQVQTPEEEPVAKLYQYADKTKKMNEETLKQLRSVVPSAVFSLDEEQGRILVVASAKEQKQLAQAVTELEAAAMPEKDKIVVSYRMPSSITSRFSSMLRQLIAKKELEGIIELRDPRQGRVTVWATAEQHAIIRNILDEVSGRSAAAQTKDGEPVEPALQVYPMEQGSAYTAHLVLANLIADAEFSYDYRTNGVIVVAAPGVQDVVRKAVEQLDRGVDQDIAFIALKKEIPQDMMRQLARMAPKTVVVQNRRDRQVIAQGPKSELDRIKAVLGASASASSGKDEIVVQSLQTASPASVVAVLADVFPEVEATVNAVANQLVLRMRGDLKQPVRSLLEQLDGHLEFIPVQKVPPEDWMRSLRTVAPRATVVIDRENGQIMVQGAAGDVEKIRKMIAQSENALPINREVVVHTLKHAGASTVASILRRIYPSAEITTDPENERLIARVRPDQKESFQSLLAQLDAADPDREKRFFKAYPLETGLYSLKSGYRRYAPVEFLRDLQKLVPKAKLSFDEHSQQLIVWATEEEHRTIAAAVQHLSGDGQTKQYRRFQLRRTDPAIIITIVRRLFPTAIPTFDYRGQSVIVEGHPRVLEKIERMIETLDPSEPSPHDPVVRFYALQSEPTSILVRGLQRLVPGATITPDRDAKQIMVIAKPDEQKIVESNVKTITATFTAPEEPMLFIYPATQDQRKRLEAFVRTAARDLKGVSIVPDQSPNQVSVWAKPSEHQLIATVLKQMHENRANEPDRQLKVFQMSIGDLTTAQDVLKVSHPDATLFVDRRGNRLLVWATPGELEKISQTLSVQGNLDNRQMLGYPVVGAKPETVMKVIQDVFKGLRITPEPQTRRLLVWASPEEHVKVAEIVEQANREADADSELAEKYVAYSSARLDAGMIRNLFKSLIPEADVYADATAEKITVRARNREHAKIRELLEQLREKDDKLRLQLSVYSYGEIDPVMIEALLRNQLPHAESMSSDDIVYRLSWTLYYERMPWYRGSRRADEPKKSGYFKIDPQTQSVYVFANGEDQREVAQAIEQIVAAGSREGAQLVARRYSLEEMGFYDIHGLLQQIAPSAFFQSIYTYTPRSGGGRYNFSSSYRDFLAYARESEQVKIETLVRELNDRAGAGRKELLSVTLPEGSKYGREKIIETIRTLYPDVVPIPGDTPGRILFWATKHQLDQIRRMIDEVCKPAGEAERTVVKSYPLRYIGVEEATSWLSLICPNASFNPDAAAANQANRRQPRRTASQRPGTPQSLVVLATPLEHAEIARAIEEIDKDLPGRYKMIPRIYTLDEYSASVFQTLRVSLMQAFSNIACTSGAERQSILVVATEDDHRQVADFLKAYRDDRDGKRPLLEVYVLKRLNYYRIQSLIQRVAPAAMIFPGSKPEQIAVWGTPKEHLDVSGALVKLETASTEKDNQSLKVFKVGSKKASLAARILSYQFPGTLTFAVNQDEVLSWGNPTDHESMAAMLQTVAEAFPEPVLKTYYFKHIPLGEGFTILSRMYSTQATISVRQGTGDLLVHAGPDIQAKIASNIAEFDVPRPADTEALPVAYDLSDIPLGQLAYAAQSIRTALPGLIVLPSSVPGQLVVWGKIADQQKVRTMVEQMLLERPENTSRMQAYSIHRGTAAAVTPMLRLIAPNARFGYGTSPNRLLVWSKDADQQKIREAIDKMNEADVSMTIEAYSLKNIYATGARLLVRNLVVSQGLDARIFEDYYGNQLVVQAKSEDQKTIRELLDKLRTEDRELEVFVLEVVDPLTAYTAINALFADESYYTMPGVDIDQNTNMIFVQGTRDQLDKTRQMLVNMGETQLARKAPSAPISSENIRPESEPATGWSGGSLPKAGSSQLRVIRIEGNVQDTIRELERLWPQYQQNRLLINREEQPLIQKKEDPPQPAPETAPPVSPSSLRLAPPEDASLAGFFSIAEELQKPSAGKKAAATASGTTPAPNATPAAGASNSVSDRVRSAAPNVYVTANEDGSLTVASYDTEALDRLESLLKRIADRVVFEGRDYTIYSVRNISATLVASKLRLILRERLAGRQPTYGASYYARFQIPRLEITPDETTNTIYVRGAKAERNEVANLIALLDVSELPGERMVRKPIKVPIRNTHAIRIAQQVLNVYQQKIMSTRLPGGVFPRVAVDNVTNSIEIIAPEPLASELKEYAEDLDRRTVEEPARKVHVIPLEVKAQVIQNALQVIRQSSIPGF